MFGQRLRQANRVARRRAHRVAFYSLFPGTPRATGYYRKHNPSRFVCDPDCSRCRPYPWEKGWTKERRTFLMSENEVEHVW
jgi:hypothetical protein